MNKSVSSHQVCKPADHSEWPAVLMLIIIEKLLHSQVCFWTLLSTFFSVLLVCYCFSWLGLLDNNALPTLCQQFVFVYFLFKHDNAPVHEAAPWRNGFPSLAWSSLTGLHRALTPSPSNTLGKNTDCEPDLITQHQCCTSQMLKLATRLLERLKPEEWMLL